MTTEPIEGAVPPIETYVLKVLEVHQYALGHEGIAADGEVAWLKCICGWEENFEMETDDIRLAERRWNEHLSEEVGKTLTEAGFAYDGMGPFRFGLAESRVPTPDSLNSDFGMLLIPDPADDPGWHKVMFSVGTAVIVCVCGREFTQQPVTGQSGAFFYAKHLREMRGVTDG